MFGMSAAVKVLTAILTISGSACGSTTSPNCTDAQGRGELAPNAVEISCSTNATNLQCQAVARATGLYVYCPIQQDVTQSAIWTVDDTRIVTMVAPGVFRAVATGDTFVRASWQSFASPMRPVSVFAGSPPVPTQEIFGTVSRKGEPPFTGAIVGAVIEILDGLVAGRTATSGVPPPLLPGYLGPFGGPGYYRLLGVPPGTYRLRISKDGYISQERLVTVGEIGSPLADFQLEPN
jgi:hypothetical protein